MIGDFTIDGQSAYDTFGVFLLKNGFKSIVELPKFKSVETTDWLEQDGLDVDLSAPVIDARQINLSLGIADISKLSELYDLLTSTPYHSFSFSSLFGSWTTQLRLASTTAFNSLINAGTITLSFYEDEYPLDLDTLETPYALGYTRVTQRGFTLDGVDFSRFGCWVLDGTRQNLNKAPNVKQNLTINSSRTSGQTYHGQTDVVFSSKEFTMQLLINARNATEFKKCLMILYTRLVQSGERTINLATWAVGLRAYYKGMSVGRLELCKSGTIWMEFSLSFVLLDYRPSKTELSLAREENGYYIITEDGKLLHIATT